MAVTRTLPVGREEYFQEVDRLINSHSLRGSESLCKLLQYLAQQALDHPGEYPKEYQIATEVYGRKADFDPQSDSTIRVQAGRLRQKLTEYYLGEGAADPIIVRLPKGSYHLSFEYRSADVQNGGLQLATPQSTKPVQDVSRFWRPALLVLSVALVIALLALGDLLWSRRIPAAAATTSVAGENPALRAFWAPFISGPEEPWAIFSNAHFVGRPETGMRYVDPGVDGKATVSDHYTGVGEVLAVHELDELFDSLGRRLRVKRGSLFSLDDAKNTDLIFVGSPSENLSLLDIPGTQEFVFQRVTSGPRQGDLAILTRHPRPGEAEFHLASPANEPLTEDYGIVSVIAGVDPSRSVMILAGTTTFGTQGAVEFACRPDSVEHLLRQITKARSGPIGRFEALVRVKIARGVPLESELVDLRQR
jgi:hypothetical protein